MSAGCYSLASMDFLARVDGKLLTVRIGSDSQLWTSAPDGHRVLANSGEAMAWIEKFVLPEQRDSARRLCRPPGYVPPRANVPTN